MLEKRNYLGSIDSVFVFFGSSAIDFSNALLYDKPYGGTAVLCRRSIAENVILIECNNLRITAIELQVPSPDAALLASVYVPVNVEDKLMKILSLLLAVLMLLLQSH